MTAKGPEGGPEWLKQFDAMLPGYSLKNELDILTLLKQVEVLSWNTAVSAAFTLCWVMFLLLGK